VTDPIDDMLTDAGRQWRAGQPEPPEPDTARWSARPSRSRRFLPVLAAAAVTVAVAGTAVVLASRPDRTGDPNRTYPGLTDPVAAAAAETLVVRDGDTVQASGDVLSLPGEPVRFCAPAPIPLSGGGGPEATCRFSVPVTGVDLAALTNATSRNGVREGSAQLTGVWRSGTLTVTRQEPLEIRTPESPAPETAPCAAPRNGWLPNPEPSGGDPHLTEAFVDYLERQHPEKFRPRRMVHPGDAQVLVIEVVEGDVDQARHDLEQRYTGNLCVLDALGRPSLADQRRIFNTVGEAVGRLMDDRSNGIYSSSNDDTVRPEMVILTPQLYDKLARIGFAVIEPRPWLRPA
jgi:hypothetical protein